MALNSDTDWKPSMRRICRKCGKWFMPTGRASKVCEKCKEKDRKKYLKRLKEKSRENARKKNLGKEKM